MRQARIAMSFAFLLLLGGLFAQDAGSLPESGREGDTPSAPLPQSYGLLMLGEFFLPGSAHVAMGDVSEGVVELCLSLPLLGVGQGLIWYYYLAPRNGETSPLLRPGYPYGQEDWYLPRRWMLELGVALDSAGRAVAAYSAWTAHRDYLIRHGGGAEAHFSPLDALLAPFQPRHLLSPEVIPVAALIVLASFPPDGLERAEDFFRAESQPFWGSEFPTAGAFCLKAASALAVSLFSSIAREAAFRGLSLERDGLLASIGLSSSYTLLSMTVPGASIGELALGAVSEAAYSWYAARLASGEGGLGRAIALRFWGEAASSLIGYVMDPEAPPALSAGICLRY